MHLRTYLLKVYFQAPLQMLNFCAPIDGSITRCRPPVTGRCVSVAPPAPLFSPLKPLFLIGRDKARLGYLYYSLRYSMSEPPSYRVYREAERNWMEDHHRSSFLLTQLCATPCDAWFVHKPLKDRLSGARCTALPLSNDLGGEFSLRASLLVVSTGPTLGSNHEDLQSFRHHWHGCVSGRLCHRATSRCAPYRR